MFSPVDQQPDFPGMETAVLQRWKDHQTFQASLEARADGPLFSFNEGPPTANGRPGVHHVEARVFKDIFPRYRTMKGYRVPRKAGWDCHGIPVELEIEKQLGFTHKQEIEDYGVEAFNALCRESVETYVDEWTRLTERIAFWVDTDDAYWTMDTSYVESVWWSLKQLWDAGLLYEGHKVLPYCGRCGTSLSDHEVAQGYDQAEDPSVYVRFPLTDGALAEAGASLAVWTTTPWTLISNTLVAVGEDVAYVLAQGDGDAYPVVIARDLVEAVLGEGATIHRDVAVQELIGQPYRAPFDYVVPEGRAHYVTTADFVTTSDGTGLVHMAPAFGADDYAIGQREGVEVVNPVDLEGRFTERVTPWAGLFVKDADAGIIEALREAGLLIRAETYTHTYPFCWRCKNPLLYYAKPSWYVATSQYKDKLLAVNAEVDWHPEHIRDGRYGDWLSNNIDWALSRSRYWGTPLPVWRCDGCEDTICVGSRAELGDLAGSDLSTLDPHRPYIDDITFECRRDTGDGPCGGTMTRVPDVIDAWYDSGAMPFAQFGYPYAEGSEQTFSERFPADYICEAIDQTRGWFYSLMAESTLLFEQNSYRTVLCLGHIVDADGKKMSKSLGNIISPWEIVDRHGADPLRWLLLTDGSPWINRRVGHGPVEDVVRRFFLTLWNSYYFFVTYARIDGWTPDARPAPPIGERPVMDRWILSELAQLITTVDEGLEAFDATTAGRALEDFVDGLSNWYIRRTRSRFWAAGTSADKDAAFATLHECLVTLSALLAPFTPFVAESLYDNLVCTVDADAPDSVHLLDFPVPDAAADDADLRRAMAAARQVVTLGLRARNEAQIGVRQPLPRALVTLPDADGWDRVAGVVAEELNLKAIEQSEGGDTVSYQLKASFRDLGRVFGKQTPDVAAAITRADPDPVVAAVRAGQSVELVLGDGTPVTVDPSMVQIVEESREGWTVATEGGVSVALDLTVDDVLRREGLARELIRTINDQRKQLDLQLSDRIRLELAIDGQLERAVADHRETICRETLATDITDGAASGGAFVEVGGHAARIRIEVNR